MIITALAALITAIVTALILRPLVDAHSMRAAAWTGVAIPLTALGLYLWMGMPDLRAAPALLETEGPRADVRALAAQELVMMQALSEDPGNIPLMLTLGDTRLKAGRIDEAVRILEQARVQAPAREDVLTALGAAYYAQGIATALKGEGGDVRTPFEQALEVAPKDAPYRARLQADIERLSQE